MKNEKTIYDKADYKRLKAFSDTLLNERSRLGRIVSSKSLRLSSAYIHEAVLEHLINSGAAVRR